MEKAKLVFLNLLVLFLIVLSLFGIYKLKLVSDRLASHQKNQDIVAQYEYLTTNQLAKLESLGTTTRIIPTGETKVFTLEAKEARWEIMPGVVVTAVTYNGTVPGPEIRVTEGDMVKIILKNHLKSDTSIHWHGLHLPNKQDGVAYVTQNPVKPGGTYTYEFLAGHAGTYMYHPHINSVEQIDRGLYGSFIIDPQDMTNQPEFDREYTFVLGGWQVPASGIDRPKMLAAMKLGGQHTNAGMDGMDMPEMANEGSGKEGGKDGSGMSMGGMDYNFWSINGKSFPATPKLEVSKDDRVRIRLINISNASHPMHLHGSDFRVIAEDSHPLGEPKIVNVIDVGPGKTFDIEFLADNEGDWIFHCHELHHTENDGVELGGLVTLIKYEGENKDAQNNRANDNDTNNMPGMKM